MKVALLGEYPQDPECIVGGPAAAVASLADELARLPDLSLHIISCVPGLSTARVVRSAVGTITRLPRGRLGRATWHVRETRHMVAALRDDPPDVVHAQGLGLYAGAAIASGCRHVVTAHGIFGQEARLAHAWPDRMRGALDSAYERWALRRTRHLIVISPYVEQVFSAYLQGETHLIENPCDVRFYDVARQVMPGRLLLVGVVIPRKGLLPLLKALPHVRQAVPAAHLRIAGSIASHPDYYAECVSYVRHAGLEAAVTFLGHLSQEQLFHEYATASAFVLPSFQETAPIALEQAMAAGVPVVATRAGGVPDMVEDGVSGCTVPLAPFPQGDPAVLAKALIATLRDAGRAKEMALNARRIAEERFRPERVARRTHELYQRILGDGGCDR